MERTRVEVKKKTLKDGTVKEYRYERKYTPKSDKVVFGKTDLIARLNACKDKEKFDKIKQLFDELGI